MNLIHYKAIQANIEYLHTNKSWPILTSHPARFPKAQRVNHSTPYSSAECPAEWPAAG